MLADDVATRLESTVDALSGRIKPALDLSEMMRRKALPNYTPAAFVLPNGIAGGRAQSSENAFLQMADELVSVVLIQRSAGDVRGSKGQAPLQTLVWAVILALCGWEPAAMGASDASGSDPVGVLELRRGRLLSLDAGTVFYQLDFAISQQVRVIS